MKNTPKTIIEYLIKEYSKSLIIFFLIFLSLILLLTFIQELVFFKDQDLGGNFYLRVFLLSFAQAPSLVISMSSFIILFASVFFYTKLVNNYETTPVKLSGLSDNFLMIIPSLYSMFIGIILILIVTPISSELTKYYENVKRSYAKNENLIVMSNTGMWLKENSDENIFIIRADKINNENFENLTNVTLYKFDLFNNFKQRLDAKKAQIKGKNWSLQDVFVTDAKDKRFEKQIVHSSKIDLKEITNFYINAQVLSIWNINKELKKIRERGYFGQEIIVILNKYLSLPFFLFAMTSLSTVFTLKINIKFSNFSYIFICIVTGILIYFLSDLSIALGKSGKIPIALSVWVPVIIIMTIPIYSLLND